MIGIFRKRFEEDLKRPPPAGCAPGEELPGNAVGPPEGASSPFRRGRSEGATGFIGKRLRRVLPRFAAIALLLALQASAPFASAEEAQVPAASIPAPAPSTPGDADQAGLASPDPSTPPRETPEPAAATDAAPRTSAGAGTQADLERLMREETSASETARRLREEGRELAEQGAVRLALLLKQGLLAYLPPGEEALADAPPAPAPSLLAICWRLREDRRIFAEIERREGEISPVERYLAGIREQLASISPARPETSSPARAEKKTAAYFGNRPPLPLFTEPISVRRGRLRPPVEGEIIVPSALKAHASSRNILYNSGMIIRTSDGRPVRAIHEGVVVYADPLGEYGKVMIIDHGYRYYSLMAHIDKPTRKAGEVVRSGDEIGTVGKTGPTGAPGLYVEVRHHGAPLDPMEWFSVKKLAGE